MSDQLLAYPRFRAATVPAIMIGAMIAFQAGTGGAQTADYYRQRGPKGYSFVPYGDLNPPRDPAPEVRTPLDDLARIRGVLKPSVTDLAGALGVSRQAIYDWQSGKAISSENARRLAGFARAADVLSTEGVAASPRLLQRKVQSGNSLLDIARQGGSLEEAARVLASIIQREAKQRQVLAARLAGRRRPLDPDEDYGPAVSEID